MLRGPKWRDGSKVLHFFKSHLFPDHIFVISAVDQFIDFAGRIVVKQPAAFHAFAKEYIGCFGQQFFARVSGAQGVGGKLSVRTESTGLRTVWSWCGSLFVRQFIGNIVSRRHENFTNKIHDPS